jgi:hypothetical protein
MFGGNSFYNRNLYPGLGDSDNYHNEVILAAAGMVLCLSAYVIISMSSIMLLANAERMEREKVAQEQVLPDSSKVDSLDARLE